MEGLLKETQQREEMKREHRERALMEERNRLMAEMENEAAQKKQPILTGRVRVCACIHTHAWVRGWIKKP